MTRKATPATVDLDATRQRLDRLGLLHAGEHLDTLVSEAMNSETANNAALIAPATGFMLRLRMSPTSECNSSSNSSYIGILQTRSLISSPNTDREFAISSFSVKSPAAE